MAWCISVIGAELKGQRHTHAGSMHVYLRALLEVQDMGRLNDKPPYFTPAVVSALVSFSFPLPHPLPP